jgi:hypothetical protein
VDDAIAKCSASRKGHWDRVICHPIQPILPVSLKLL